jgi:signal transduction histidine kinase
LVANLLDNAVRYNVAGGTVKVVTGTDNITSCITVTNTGPMVPPAAVASLLEPFRRMKGADSDTRGVGLGLSIVASVVTAHGGKLVLEALPDGGLSISVALGAPNEVRERTHSH